MREKIIEILNEIDLSGHHHQSEGHRRYLYLCSNRSEAFDRCTGCRDACCQRRDGLYLHRRRNRIRVCTAAVHCTVRGLLDR